MTTLGRILRYLWSRVIVVVGAVVMTVGLFLVLPVLQAISQGPQADTIVQAVSTANLPPPPPPPPEEEKEPEKEEEAEEKPKLIEPAPPLDLQQLELALNTGGGGSSWGGPNFDVRLPVGNEGSGSSAVDQIFQLADLDQKPRVLYQPAPTLSAELKKKSPATVNVIFIVDARGRVDSPVVQSSSDPSFEPAALSAVKQWKFEPGKRNGEAVRFRMRVPISFPKDR